MRSLTVLALALLVALGVGGPAGGNVDDESRSLAAELRCPVCQNLSVADSPSEMARQMRELIRDRLLHGESREAVKAYLVERYGEWILLVPPRRGFPLLAWVVPWLGLAVGLAGAVRLLGRWVRRSSSSQVPEVDEAYVARVRREVQRRKDA